MKAKFRKIRGTRDWIGRDFDTLIEIFEISREVFNRYGYSFILTPTFEDNLLFVKSTGEHTDIVQKEMYVFEDLGGRKLALRPEGTPPVLRAIVENNIEIPTKLAYFMNMFRYERPQKGRYREFFQLGAEAVGYKEPYIDAEILILIKDILSALKVKDYSFEINTVGCPKDRNRYSDYLKEFFKDKIRDFCNDCQRRYEKNPFRIIDCKVDREKIKGIRYLKEFLCNECDSHYNKLLNILKYLNFFYKENPYIVRGLDYYTKTAFEVVSGELGAQDSICGGGRYDLLLESIGGNSAPGIGFAFGVERIILARKGSEKKKKEPLVYVVYVSEKERDYAFRVLKELREKRIYCEMEYDLRSLKSQMKRANRKGARFALIIGEEEIKTNKFRIRDMEKGKEELVNDLDSYLKRFYLK